MRKLDKFTDRAMFQSKKEILGDKFPMMISCIETLLVNKGLTEATQISRSWIILDIALNNVDNFEELYNQYQNSTSTKERYLIRHGKDASNQYNKTLKTRKRNGPIVSVLTIKYWIDKGHTEAYAKEQISIIQRSNASKRSRESYRKFGESLKSCAKYWIKLGHSIEESELLRQPFLTSKNDLDSMIIKYGKELGTIKYNIKIQKYKETMDEVRCNNRTGGYVSNESLKVFVPIYKECRRLGLQRNEIYFGINGSSEFFIRDPNSLKNKGAFYDFTIPKLKLIIEYHGTFWHPREDIEWKNPWGDRETAVKYDLYKEYLVSTKGYKYITIWSDENKELAIQRVMEQIKNAI